MKIETKPVYDKDGDIVLYDMWIDDKWHGSRRTLKQVDMHYEHVRKCEEECCRAEEEETGAGERPRDVTG